MSFTGKQRLAALAAGRVDMNGPGSLQGLSSAANKCEHGFLPQAPFGEFQTPTQEGW